MQRHARQHTCLHNVANNMTPAAILGMQLQMAAVALTYCYRSQPALRQVSWWWDAGDVMEQGEFYGWEREGGGKEEGMMVPSGGDEPNPTPLLSS